MEQNKKVYLLSGYSDLESDICDADEKNSEISIYDNIHYESDCENIQRPEFIFSSKQVAEIKFNDFKKKYYQMLHYALIDSSVLLKDEDIPDLSVTDNGSAITIDLPQDSKDREDDFVKVVITGGIGDSFNSFSINLSDETGNYNDNLVYLSLKEVDYDSVKEKDIINLNYAESEYEPQQTVIMGSITEGDVTEPIEWIFVDRHEDRALIVSRKGLFLKSYDEKETLNKKPQWRESTLREWLNTEFYNNCFTVEERDKILLCADDEANIHEKIFLLSGPEIFSDFPRLWLCKPCDSLNPYVFHESERGLEGRVPWFLRDAPDYKNYGHYGQYQIAGILAADYFDFIFDGKEKGVVRPAMWIKYK